MDQCCLDACGSPLVDACGIPYVNGCGQPTDACGNPCAQSMLGENMCAEDGGSWCGDASACAMECVNQCGDALAKDMCGKPTKACCLNQCGTPYVDPCGFPFFDACGTDHLSLRVSRCVLRCRVW